MSRIKSIVLTVGALTIAGHSCVPPWVAVHASGGGPPPAEVARVTVTRPLGSYPLFEPPTSSENRFVRVDYGRLALYYLGTIALALPFFVWRRRSPRASDDR